MTADFRMLQMSIPLAEVQSGPREGRSMNPEEAQETEGSVLGFGRLFQQAAEELDDEPAGDAATDPEGGKDLPERQSTGASESGLPVATAGSSPHAADVAVAEAEAPAQAGGRYLQTEPSLVPAFGFGLPSSQRGKAAGVETSVAASDQTRFASTTHPSFPMSGATNPPQVSEQKLSSPVPGSSPETSGTVVASSLSSRSSVEKGTSAVPEKELTVSEPLVGNDSDAAVVAGEDMGYGRRDDSLRIDWEVNEPLPASSEVEFSQRETGKADSARPTGSAIRAVSGQTMEGTRSGNLVPGLSWAEQSPFELPAMPEDSESSAPPLVQKVSTPLSATNLAERRLAQQEISAKGPMMAEQVTDEGGQPLQESRSTSSTAAVHASVVGMQAEGDRGKPAENGQGLRMAMAPASPSVNSGNSEPVTARELSSALVQQGIPTERRAAAMETPSEAGVPLQESRSTASAAAVVPASAGGVWPRGDRRTPAENIQGVRLATALANSDSGTGNPMPVADASSQGLSPDSLPEDSDQDMSQFRPIGDARFSRSPASPPHTSSSQGQMPSPVPEGRIDEFPGQKSWEQSMARQMLEFATSGTQRAILRLQPENLGTLDVRLHTEEGEARIQFSTPHALVKDAVEGALPRLREMFQSGGLNLVEVNVSGQESSARQQAAGGDGRGNQPGQGHSFSSFESPENLSSEPLVEPGDNLIDCYI